MPIRRTTITERGFIPIPKDMNKASWMVIITDSSGTTRDVTDYFSNGFLDLKATDGISNFSINIDNNNGRYKDKFSPRDSVDFYYDYKEKSGLDVIRWRFYIDYALDNFDISSGLYLIIEGRDAPTSDNNEHFADTTITIQFEDVNILDCWVGVSGEQDSEGNYEDGVLYNSGLILKIYDISDSSWKIYKDLTAEQKLTIKSRTGYTSTHAESHQEVSRLTISQKLATEGDYDFRLEYNSGDDATYIMVHPENAILNTSEHVTAGQNLIGLSRYGADTTTEANRVKIKGASDGDLLLMATKKDTTRQEALWIKDLSESNSALSTNNEVSSKATTRLNELKEALKKGTLVSCALPSLKPAEKIPINLPYVINANIKVKSITINFSTDIEFSLDLQNREIRFEKLIKDNTDETKDVSTIDNINGLRNGIIWDFSNTSTFSFTNCEVVNNKLALSSGQVTGSCTTSVYEADENIDKFELRLNGDQFRNCTYRVSNNNGQNWQSCSLNTLLEFTSTGSQLRVEITLNESTTGVSPEIDKINLLV